jgi:sulfite oxidase
MQCSGTRRIEQIGLYAGQGDEVPQAPWAEGAIGNAEYIGISLKKVIKECGGLKDPGKHLEFYGADTYFKDNEAMNYVVSVPVSKLMGRNVTQLYGCHVEFYPAQVNLCVSETC